MPTTKPRYTVTDTGELHDMLDAAQVRWPQITDRRSLLLALAAAGHDAIVLDVREAEQERLRARQQLALARAPELVEEPVLLSDAAWH